MFRTKLLFLLLFLLLFFVIIFVIIFCYYLFFLSISRRVPVLTCAIQDFNFCPGPLSDETHSTYYLIIANSGQIEAEWYENN